MSVGLGRRRSERRKVKAVENLPRVFGADEAPQESGHALAAGTLQDIDLKNDRHQWQVPRKSGQTILSFTGKPETAPDTWRKSLYRLIRLPSAPGCRETSRRDGVAIPVISNFSSKDISMNSASGRESVVPSGKPDRDGPNPIPECAESVIQAPAD